MDGLLSLLPGFGSVAFTVLAFIIALSVIVAIHEYGHYIVGRWSGIQADVFSVGFGPVLFARTDSRGTQWQVAALPLGGYVKFRGDADVASMAQADTPGLDDEARRATMSGAPLWARSATVAAGPLFNFVLSFLLFAAVLMLRGVASDPLTVEDLRPLPQEMATLEPGDALLRIEGREVPSLDGFDAFIADLPVAPRLDYTVNRDGAETVIEGPYPYPPLVAGVSPESAAMAAGLEAGDVITAVNGTEIFAFDQLREAVEATGGAPLDLEIWRPDADGGGDTLSITLEPKRTDLPLADGGFDTRWMIGVSGGFYIVPETRRPGVIEAARYGVEQTAFIVRASLSGLYNMATGQISSCNLRGPVSIARTSGVAASQGALSFLHFVALLSTAVGLLNLFPIPVLDGGHLVFHAYEAVSGKPPGVRVMNVLMAIGLALMGLLMVFALNNDFFCP
ncbi:RIP metalloprotease RseP [Palleronia sediminis]|uniref:Zinc metalloprotease n=1 Tax=Palleronia sediminis TaxID=2547833 RepID=A0A4R6AJN0_9RHOB|nr:RIP metalloprotease RseP [Palleronia sediminis]TDL83555.1 RIP metalloprotease RseP [Palleronia sediminis]